MKPNILLAVVLTAIASADSARAQDDPEAAPVDGEARPEVVREARADDDESSEALAGYALVGALGGWVCAGEGRSHGDASYLIGARLEVGTPIISDSVFVIGSGLYTGGHTDARTGYGMAAAGARAFLGERLTLTASSELGYGLLHSHNTDGVGNMGGVSLAMSLGAGWRSSSLIALVEFRTLATPGLVVLSGSPMVGARF